MYFLRKFLGDVLEKRTFSVTKVMAILISVLLSINGVSTAVNNTVSTTLVAETSPSQGRTTAISVDGSTEAITFDDDTAVEPSGNSSLVTSFDVFNLTTKAVDHIDEQRDSVLSTEGPVKATSASVSTATTEGHSEGETREPSMGGGETTTSVDGSMVVLTSDGTTAVETSENPSLTTPFDELNLTTKVIDHTDEERDSILSTSLSTLDGDISSTSMQGKVSQIDVTSSTENVEVTSEVMGTTSPEAEDKTVSTSVEMTDEEMSSAERTVTSSTETERITNGQEVVTGTSLTQSIENVTTPVDQTISPSKVIGPDDITVKADEVTSTLISITGKDFTTFITGDIQSVSPSAEADETTTTVDLGTTPMPGVHSGVTTIITEDGTDDFYTSVESHLSPSTQKDEIITSSEIAGTTGLPSTEDSDDFSTNATKEDTNAVTTEGELHTVTVTSKMRDIATSPITDIEDVGITTAAEQGVITSGESADEISTSVKTMDPSDTEGEGTEVMETQSIGTTEGSSSATSIQMNLKVTSPTPSPFLPSVERSLSTDSPSTLPETTLLLTTQPLHTAVFLPSVSSSSTTSSRPSASAAVQTTQTRSTEPSFTQQVTTPAEESTTTSRVSTTLKVITKKKVPTTKVIKTTTKKMVKKVDENSLEKEKILSFYFEAKDLKKQKKRKRSDQPSNEDGDVIEIWYDEYDEKFRNNIAKVARKEAGTKDRPDADDVFYVSPTPEVRGDRFVVSVVVKSPEEAATYMEAAPLLASLKKGLQEMELEYEAFVGPAKPVREERGSGTLFDHPIILVILLLVAFLCLIIIIIGMMYLLCDKHLSSRRGEYITQYSTANDPEMSFDNPVMQEKDPANGAHLLGVRTDAEGQDIAPLECFPAEELHRNYEVEDTHL